jgi:hypothetical protein
VELAALLFGYEGICCLPNLIVPEAVTPFGRSDTPHRKNQLLAKWMSQIVFHLFRRLLADDGQAGEVELVAEARGQLKGGQCGWIDIANGPRQHRDNVVRGPLSFH